MNIHQMIVSINPQCELCYPIEMHVSIFRFSGRPLVFPSSDSNFHRLFDRFLKCEEEKQEFMNKQFIFELTVKQQSGESTHTFSRNNQIPCSILRTLHL